MSTVPLNEIGQEFVRNKIGLVGIGILATLFIISAMAVLTIPLETLKTWNNPESWLEFPKTALPAWINLFLSEKIPEHKILTNSEDSLQSTEELTIFSQQFSVVYEFDDFPNDFIYEFTAKYSGSPLLQISVIRPDGMTVELLSRSLPYLESAVHHERVFSTDNAVKKNLILQSEKFGFLLNDISAEQIVFSESSVQKVLNGKYVFLIRLVGTSSENEIIASSLILGGKVFGFVGTLPETWVDADFTQKQQLQSLIFPEKPVYTYSGFETPVLSPIFATKKTHRIDESSLVTPRGIEPRFAG